MSAPGETRTYHATDADYSLPNDSIEHRRLDEQSRAITTMIGGRPFLTDLSFARGLSTAKAADMGCGTGILTNALAVELKYHLRDNADTQVYGLDISAVPTLHPKQTGVTFIRANVMDVEELSRKDSRFAPGSFDYVTHRMLILGIPDWTEYLRLCFLLLKPGGRIELQDLALRWYDINGAEISRDWKWVKVLRKASSKLCLDLLSSERFVQLLQDAGFTDVEERVYKWHGSDEHWEEYPDSDEIGRYSVNTLNPDFPPTLSKLVKKAGFDEKTDLEGLASTKELEEDCFNTAMRLRKGSHLNFYVVCGRKP